MSTEFHPLDLVVDLLDLEPIEVNLFRGVSPQENRQRVFGGQVAGQALVAAARTVDDPQRMVHSLHAYFLRPGDPSIPILYEVDRIRDGRSFTTRRVVAIQHGQAIFNLQASFHIPENGLSHQLAIPDVPGPDDTPRLQDPDGAVQGEARRVLRPAAADRSALHRCRTVRTPRTERDHPTGLAARRRRPARRSDVARLCRHLRLGHDLARHRRPATRDRLGRRAHPDGQPRPCDVVPPAVPCRRLAALRPGDAVGVERPRLRPAARSSPATARWRSASSKKV